MTDRCVDGTIFRTPRVIDPMDPYYEIRVGPCPKCKGEGCDQYQHEGECDCCGEWTTVRQCWAGAMETWACEQCRHESEEQ